MSVADGFAEHDDIRNDILLFEAVEILPQPAVARLHFVRYTHAAGRTDFVIHRRQIALREQNLSADAWAAFGNVAEKTGAPRSQLRDSLADGFGIPWAGMGIRGLEFAAIDFGQPRHVDPRRLPPAARTVELVRADVDHRVRVSMIGGVEHDEIDRSGMGSRETQRQLIGLAAGIDEIADAQR